VHFGLSAALTITYLAWVCGRPRLALLVRMPSLIKQLSAELHPFIPALAVCLFLADSWGQPLRARVLQAAIAALQLISWLVSPNDDDRWKRRRRRLAARLRTRPRLRVAEMGAPSGAGIARRGVAVVQQ